MILVDTNVWIAHLESSEPDLAAMLPRREALIHPFTIGEIALGRLPARDAVLTEFSRLPAIVVARHDEVMRMIEARGIRGIGYVDSHLLASAQLVPGVRLWTRDKRLMRVADGLSILAALA